MIIRYDSEAFRRHEREALNRAHNFEPCFTKTMNKSKVRHRISSQHIVETLRKSEISEYFHSLDPPSRVFPKTSTHYYVAIRRNVLLLSLKIFRRLSNLRSERYSDESYYYLGWEEVHVYVRRGRAGGRVGGTGAGAYRPVQPAQAVFYSTLRLRPGSTVGRGAAAN